MSDAAISSVNGVEITRPAKHGLSLEWSPAAGMRVVVRLFAFEEGMIEGTKVDVPRAVDEVQVLELLVRTCMLLGGLQETAPAQRCPTTDGTDKTAVEVEDPLAGGSAVVLPVAEENLRKIYASLRGVLLEAQGYAQALVGGRQLSAEDAEETGRALLRDLELGVTCVRGLVSRNSTNVDVRATVQSDDTQVVPTMGKRTGVCTVPSNAGGEA